MKTVAETQISKPKRTATNKPNGRLFFLEASSGRSVQLSA